MSILFVRRAEAPTSVFLLVELHMVCDCSFSTTLFFCLSHIPLLVLIPFSPSLILTFYFLISPSIVFTVTKICESSVFQLSLPSLLPSTSIVFFFFLELHNIILIPVFAYLLSSSDLILVTNVSTCHTTHVSLSSDI